MYVLFWEDSPKKAGCVFLWGGGVSLWDVFGGRNVRYRTSEEVF